MSETPIPENEAPEAATPAEETLPVSSETDVPQTSSPSFWDDDDAEERGDQPMPILGHLGELRTRLFRCLIAVLLGFFACYAGAEVLYDAILLPVHDSLPERAKIVFTVLTGPFFLHLKIAFLASLFVTSPYVFYQIWSFIAPGLYAEERKYMVPIACVSALFFVGGAAFCYFVVLPFAFPFFLSYSTDTVTAMLDVVEYFSFVLKLILAFGLIFEMPLFSLFLSRLGLITAQQMRRVRKYAVLGIFIVAAILTPPDVVSQLLMAAPMLVLYEISILVAVVFEKKSKKPSPDTETAAPPSPETQGEQA